MRTAIFTVVVGRAALASTNREIKCTNGDCMAGKGTLQVGNDRYEGQFQGICHRDALVRMKHKDAHTADCRTLYVHSTSLVDILPFPAAPAPTLHAF